MPAAEKIGLSAPSQINGRFLCLLGCLHGLVERAGIRVTLMCLADCLFERDNGTFAFANGLDRITRRICNPSQKYMLDGLPSPRGLLATKTETTTIATPWARGSKRGKGERGRRKRGEERKTQAYTLRKYFTCASNVLSTVASSRKTNVGWNDPKWFLAYFLELHLSGNEEAWERKREKFGEIIELCVIDKNERVYPFFA